MLPYAPLSDPLRISTPIDLVHRLRITGVSRGGTTIYLENGSDCDMMRYVGGDSLYAFALEYLSFQGNKTNQAAGRGLNVETSGGGAVYDSEMRMCSFKNMKEDAVRIQSCWGWTIFDTWAEYNDGHGFVFDGGSQLMGYRLKSALNGNSGFRFWGAEKCKLFGFETFSNMTQGAIIGATSHETLLVGGSVRDNSQAGVGASDGIYVQADRCILDDLVINGAAQERDGIRIVAGADDTKINQCQIYGQTGADITDNGARTTINGHGREDVGAPGPPAAANWDVGDIVRNTNDNTQWIKDYDGVMRQIA